VRIASMSSSVEPFNRRDPCRKNGHALHGGGLSWGMSEADRARFPTGTWLREGCFARSRLQSQGSGGFLPLAGCRRRGSAHFCHRRAARTASYP
jgi:hypothetical protein